MLSKKKNSAAQNYDFEKKKQQYFKTETGSLFALTTQVLQKQQWTPTVIEERQKELIGVLKRCWRL